MKLVLLLRSPRWRKGGMWMTNRCWTTLISNLWASLNPEPSLVHDHKEVLNRTMCVTTADFKGILDQSAPRSRGPRNDRRNWAGEPSRGGNGDPEMVDVMKMIGAFTNCFTRRFESPTPLPNPIWISPQTQVTCGWKRVLMHKHYNKSMHQYFLCFVTLFGCLLIDYVNWNMFVCFCIFFFHISCF